MREKNHRAGRRGMGVGTPFFMLPLLLIATPAHASIFQGETLDKVADILTWVVLVVAPIVGIAVFWLLHILPEKIAERKQHPQTHAIQCLCLMSLVFGGMLWPLAWLWAYSKPVMHKLAYGTDKDETIGHKKGEVKKSGVEIAKHAREQEAAALKGRIAELEKRLAGVTGGEA